jgi:hypothetical protein
MTDLKYYQDRLAETRELMKKAQDEDPSDCGTMIGLCYQEEGLITRIYELEHPGMTLNDEGQPVQKPEPKPEPIKKTPSDEDAEAESWINGMLQCLVEAKKRFKPGERGQMECPACKKLMSVSRAASNGHVWLACPTTDCIRVME